MDPEIKIKWLEALRSGRYQQGKRHLREGDRFCCLGVLCDVVDNTKWEKIDDNEHYLFDRMKCSLPIDMIIVVNLTGSYENLLINMNDVENKNFNEIADYIEKNL